MKKIIPLIIALSICLTGCNVNSGVKDNRITGGTEVSDSGGSCTIYIVEKDGYKFAVAVGYEKVSIVQIK